MPTKKHWTRLFSRLHLWIVAGLLIGILSMLILTKYVMPVKYSTSCEIHFTPDVTRKTLNNMQSVLESDMFKNRVYKEVGSSDGDIVLNIMVSVNYDKKYIVVQTETENPIFSAQVSNAYLHLSHQALEDIPSDENVSDEQLIIRGKPAVVPENSTSPVLLENLVFGGFVGAFAVTAIIVLIGLFGDTIGSADELKEVVSVPILGEIPDLF